MIKKITYSLLFLLFCVSAATARTYSVEDIPNVHLEDSSRYVSNPDGILSSATVSRLDDMLNKVRRTTSTEPVVVIVDDIEGGDIDDFATELFGKWGLGKKDLDNGLLILVAKDLRRAAIRPGYGLEGVLPDITCGRILREQMFPSFKEGDYDGGMLAATGVISEILLDPENRDEILSKEADADFANHSEEDVDFFTVYLWLALILGIALLITFIVVCACIRRKDRHDKYMTLDRLKPIYLAATFLGLGIPIIASLPLVIVLYRLRNAPHKCQNCGCRMKKVDEVHDNDYLSGSQDLEERIGSVDYDVWLCPDCGETDIEQYVKPSSGYKECPKCHAHTLRLRQDRIVRQPTVTREGQGVHEYGCLNCGQVTSVPYSIEKLAPVVPLVIGGSGRGGSGFGGGFGGGSFGGGFGGGMTGGGGASGGW